jgi:transposase
MKPLPLDCPKGRGGFDFSVLSEHRDRLIAGKAEGRVFERLVEQIRATGLIKEQGKRKTNSIAMLTIVRN